MTDKRTASDPGAYTPYLERDFSTLRGLKNLKDSLIEAHVSLYKGYVGSFNSLRQHLEDAQPGTTEWSEMQRRLGFEVNGLRLHELYFENLTSGDSRVPRALEETLSGLWGSFKRWQEEFETIGQIRGVGWVILYKDPMDGRLSNHWIGLHEEGHPAGFTPLLVMDVWEHAYAGMNRSAYIQAFFMNINWEGVGARWAGS
ncbi:MAG: Fe-Mn family superoxide dismutase [Planctomycetes bacterium]|nr:Fe-Mn family superoxide dismutase [Planctomycetota bacterium]